MRIINNYHTLSFIPYQLSSVFISFPSPLTLDRMTRELRYGLVKMMMCKYVLHKQYRMKIIQQNWIETTNNGAVFSLIYCLNSLFYNYVYGWKNRNSGTQFRRLVSPKLSFPLRHLFSNAKRLMFNSIRRFKVATRQWVRRDKYEGSLDCRIASGCTRIFSNHKESKHHPECPEEFNLHFTSTQFNLLSDLNHNSLWWFISFRSLSAIRSLTWWAYPIFFCYITYTILFSFRSHPFLCFLLPFVKYHPL